MSRDARPDQPPFVLRRVARSSSNEPRTSRGSRGSGRSKGAVTSRADRANVVWRGARSSTIVDAAPPVNKKSSSSVYCAARAACTRSAPAALRPGALPSVGPPPTGRLWMRSRMSWISRRCRSCAYCSSARSLLLTSPKSGRASCCMLVAFVSEAWCASDSPKAALLSRGCCETCRPARQHR